MSSKVQELTATTTVVGTDVLYVVADPGGTPLDRKLTFTQLVTTLGQLSPVVRLGTSTTYAKMGGTVFDHYTDTASTSTDGTEDDLYSDTIPANTLTANGAKLKGEYGVLIVGSATATRRVQAYFGGTKVLDSGTLTFASGGNATIDVTVIRETSSVVRVIARLVPGGITQQPIVTYTRITGLDFTATKVIKITGIAAGTGAAASDIVAKTGVVSYLPAA